MHLILTALPESLGSFYSKGEKPLPARIRWAHPDLAEAIDRTERSGLKLWYSDIFRTAAASQARREQFEARGGPQLAKRPGESPHNYGLSVDIDTTHALKTFKISKQELDLKLASFGLYCHRKDHALDNECWHYNALSPDAAQWLSYASDKSTSRAVEAKLQSIYGAQMILTPEQSASALAYLGYKDVKSFQSAWVLDVDGKAGPKTNRLLAYLEAEKRFFATT